MDSIPITSGFHHFELKYVWLCRSCGVAHEVVCHCEPGTPPRIPGVPVGWLILTRVIHNCTVMDAYCPDHRVIVQDNEVHVYAKDKELTHA